MCTVEPCLYGNNVLQLPFNDLTEEFEVSCTRGNAIQRLMTQVSATGIEVCTVRKWNAAKELEMAEARLRHKAVVGGVVMGRSGLDSFPMPKYDKVQGKERRVLVQGEVRAAMYKVRTSRMAGMRQQGSWTRW